MRKTLVTLSLMTLCIVFLGFPIVAFSGDDSIEFQIKYVGTIPMTCITKLDPEIDANGITFGLVSLSKGFSSPEQRKDHQPGDVHTMWGLALKKEAKPFTMHAGDCLALGVSTAGYESRGKLEPFEINKTYSLDFGTIDHGEHGVSGYSGVDFCVQRMPNGSLTYPIYDADRFNPVASEEPACGLHRQRTALIPR